MLEDISLWTAGYRIGRGDLYIIVSKIVKPHLDVIFEFLFL